MKKLLISLVIAIIVPCVSFAGQYDFQGIGVKIQNKTFDYSIKHIEVSSFVDVANAFGTDDFLYLGIKSLGGHIDKYKGKIKSCYGNRNKLTNCIVDYWYIRALSKSPLIPSNDTLPGLFYAHAVEDNLNTGFKYFPTNIFNLNGVEIPHGPISPNDFKKTFNKHFANYHKGWQQFPGVLESFSSAAISFLHIGENIQNVKFDIYDDSDNKITSAVIILTHDTEPTYFFTQPAPGLSMETGTMYIGKYGQFIYNLIEA